MAVFDWINETCAALVFLTRKMKLFPLLSLHHVARGNNARLLKRLNSGNEQFLIQTHPLSTSQTLIIGFNYGPPYDLLVGDIYFSFFEL